MSFLGIVEQAKTFLARNGRVSLRALKLEFELDDRALAALVAELVDGEARDPLEALLDEATALLVESGAPAYAPRVHEVRAELLAREADAEGADRELREARRRYQEMGATGHAERLAREHGFGEPT